MRSKLTMVLVAIVLFLVLAVSGLALADAPPALLNYQGVLRSASDAPLSGPYDMTFRLYSADLGGDEILVDAHTASSRVAVSVSGGLFNTTLGSGVVTDGAGPGTYATLADVIRDYGAVWLGVQVCSETVSPRTRVQSGAYALNASNLEGKNAASFLDTSSTTQTKTGTATFDSGATAGATGVRAFGNCDVTGSAGYFKDAAHKGEAFLGHGNTGTDSYGTYAGAIFRNGTSSAPGASHALLGHGDYGGRTFR